MSYLWKVTQQRSKASVLSDPPGSWLQCSELHGHNEHPLERWMGHCHGHRRCSSREKTATDHWGGPVTAQVQEDELAVSLELLSSWEDVGHAVWPPGGAAPRSVSPGL